VKNQKSLTSGMAMIYFLSDAGGVQHGLQSSVQVIQRSARTANVSDLSRPLAQALRSRSEVIEWVVEQAPAGVEAHSPTTEAVQGGAAHE